MVEFVVITVKETSCEIPKGGSLLDICHDNPGMIPFRCKQGICGTCQVKIINGIQNISAPAEAEINFLEKLGKSDNVIRLACQIRAYGDIELEPVNYKIKRKEYQT